MEGQKLEIKCVPVPEPEEEGQALNEALDKVVSFFTKKKGENLTWLFAAFQYLFFSIGVVLGVCLALRHGVLSSNKGGGIWNQWIPSTWTGSFKSIMLGYHKFINICGLLSQILVQQTLYPFSGEGEVFDQFLAERLPEPGSGNIKEIMEYLDKELPGPSQIIRCGHYEEMLSQAGSPQSPSSASGPVARAGGRSSQGGAASVVSSALSAINMRGGHRQRGGGPSALHYLQKYNRMTGRSGLYN